MSSPPYGVDRKAAQDSVKAEAAAMPDGQMLFLTHLAHEMRPAHEGELRSASTRASFATL